MFCYLRNNLKRSNFFFQKRPTVYNPNYFWIIPVQDWSKTSPANAVCSLRELNYSNVIDIDFLLVKKSKIDAAFLIINE